MEAFFWVAFGIFFIINSIVGLIVSIYSFFDWVAGRYHIKKLRNEQLKKEWKDVKEQKEKNS